MVALPQAEPNGDSDKDGGPGSSCNAGAERVYPVSGVRYGAMNWIGEFQHAPHVVFKCGARVVVQSDRGIELGCQVGLTCRTCSQSVSRAQIQSYIEACGPEYYRLGAGRILREATAEDIREHQRLNSDAAREVADCATLAADVGLQMKIVAVEHLLGGERVVYYFMSEGRVDFRGLVRELAGRHQTRIEMRQVGARDEARLIADCEVCGRECCCKNFLKTLRPVKMIMAKIQKATLDLSKVSGRCGRLRCCLRYEHAGYEELAAKLPGRGTWVRTDHGTGFVIDRQILTQLVVIATDDDKVVTVPIEEIREQRPAAPDGTVPGDESVDLPEGRDDTRVRRPRSQPAGDAPSTGVTETPALGRPDSRFTPDAELPPDAEEPGPGAGPPSAPGQPGAGGGGDAPPSDRPRRRRRRRHRRGRPPQ